MPLFLRKALLFASAGNRALLGTLPRPGIGLGPLAPRGEPPAMTKPPIAADVHQPLEVHRHVAAEIALNDKIALNNAANFYDLVFPEIFAPHTRIYAGFRQDPLRRRRPNPEYIPECDIDSFVFG